MAKKAIFSIIFLLGALTLLLTFNLFKKEKTQPELSKTVTEKAVSIITIYDNYQVDPRLQTGWGFACLIKASGKNLLFDTGADSPTLLSNLEQLNIALEEIDVVVLSHIHQDHVGGLPGLLERKGEVEVYIPSSFPNSIRETIESHGGKYFDISDSREIIEGIYSTGELGNIIKEQSLIINTNKGLVIITGCAHPGVVNIIKKIKEIFAGKEIFLVLGGFHLLSASDSQLKQVVDDFEKLGVKKVAPSHCSGDETRELFKEVYQDNFIENGVGKTLTFN